jgi:type I restriction enzyme S subunit
MKAFLELNHYPFDLDAPTAGWAVASVGELCESVQPGFASGIHNRTGSGIPHLRPMNVDRTGYLDLTDVKCVLPSAGDQRLLRGDVLFNNTNSPVLIGKTAVVQMDAELAFSNHMTRLRLRQDISPRYLAYQLHYLWMSGYFLHRCVNHVNQASIASSTLAETVPILVAPHLEQERIADAIDTAASRLDAAVAALTRVQRNLARYRASVLHAAVTGRLVPTEAALARTEGREYEPASVLLTRILAERRRRWEEAELAKMTAAGKAPKDERWKARYVEPVAPEMEGLGELPVGWCWATCEQLVQRLQTGPFGSTLHKSDYVIGGVPVINPQHLRDYGIQPAMEVTVGQDTASRLYTFELSEGDIVLGRRGAMGRCAVVSGKEQGWLLGTGSLALRLEVELSRHYLVWFLRSPGTVRRLEGEAVGTTMTNLNQEILLDLPIPLPPAAEQARIEADISRRFSVLDAEAATFSTCVVRIARLRQSILRLAFEGRLVDQDPDDEPAAVLLERIRAEREAGGGVKRRGRRAVVGQERLL